MKLIDRITDAIGYTPLLEFKGLESLKALNCKIIGKLEYLNPAGSIKDRVALAMVEDAEKSGRIGPGSVLIEPTSGNTGIGLAMVAAAKGYRLIITMSEAMSLERRRFMSAYGAELVLTDADAGMAGAIEKAEQLEREIDGAVIMGQFSNPANPAIHEATTGPEIWEDLDGQVDAIVAGIGTGGTITGVGRFLKSKKPDVSVIGVEPSGSPVITQGRKGSHRIEGIGGGFIPDNLDMQILDRVITVSDEDAFATTALAAKTEGVLLGISSGAAIWAALQIAQEAQFEGKTIVVILPDGGDRYLSTEVFA